MEAFTHKCHICAPESHKTRLVLEDDGGSARSLPKNDNETPIPPGVFQLGETPGVYPEGLNRLLSQEESWSWLEHLTVDAKWYQQI